MDEVDEQRYSQAFQAALRLFRNEADAIGWLHEPSISLGNLTPVSLLTSDEGLARILYEIGQMEYGHPV